MSWRQVGDVASGLIASLSSTLGNMSLIAHIWYSTLGKHCPWGSNRGRGFIYFSFPDDWMLDNDRATSWLMLTVVHGLRTLGYRPLSMQVKAWFILPSLLGDQVPSDGWLRNYVRKKTFQQYSGIYSYGCIILQVGLRFIDKVSYWSSARRLCPTACRGPRSRLTVLSLSNYLEDVTHCVQNLYLYSTHNGISSCSVWTWSVHLVPPLQKS